MLRRKFCTHARNQSFDRSFRCLIDNDKDQKAYLPKQRNTYFPKYIFAQTNIYQAIDICPNNTHQPIILGGGVLPGRR